MMLFLNINDKIVVPFMTKAILFTAAIALFTWVFFPVSSNGQTPNFKSFDKTQYHEIGDYDKYSRPKVVGKIGESVIVMQRDLERSALVTTTFIKVENGGVSKKLEVRIENDGNPAMLTNAKIVDDKVFTYGYKYRGKKNMYADQFFRIYDENLQQVGEDQIVGSVVLDHELVKMGASSDILRRFLPVLRAIYTSEIEKNEAGNYEMWMTKMGTGPSYTTTEKWIKKGKVEGEKDSLFNIYTDLNNVNFLQLEFETNGSLVKCDSTEMPKNEKVKFFQTTPKDIYDCNFIDTDDGTVVAIDQYTTLMTIGMDVFDDDKFPWVSRHNVVLIKIVDGEVKKLYKPNDGINFLTQNIWKENGKIHIRGFYATKDLTGWSGVYSLSFNTELDLIDEEFLPLEGNFSHNLLQGSKAYTLGASFKDIQGVITNSSLEEFSNGKRYLIGELYSGITVEEDIVTGRRLVTKDNLSGNRVDALFMPSDITKIDHFFNRLVIFEIDREGNYTKSVAVIEKNQRGTTLIKNRLGYTATVVDGDKLVIDFNDSDKSIKGSKASSPSKYSGDDGNSQILHRYIMDDTMNMEEVIFKENDTEPLLPRARYEDSETTIDLFSDKRTLYLAD